MAEGPLRARPQVEPALGVVGVHDADVPELCEKASFKYFILKITIEDE